jgi:predicted ribosomally synthesized peptide with SipW-like signal peptide
MKRSILLSLLVIGAVAALITAATSATFSDSVTSNGNTATAGTLFLSVDNYCGKAPDTNARLKGADTACDRGIAATFTNMAPGATAQTKTYAVRNDGSLAGKLNVTQTLVSSDPTGCPVSNWTVSTAPTNVSLAAAGTTSYILSVALNTAAGNACQGVTLTINLTFALAQA